MSFIPDVDSYFVIQQELYFYNSFYGVGLPAGVLTGWPGWQASRRAAFSPSRIASCFLVKSVDSYD